MGNVKLAIHTVLSFVFALCIFGLSFNVAADTSSAPEKAVESTTSDGRHVVTFNRDSDYACTQCHKQSKKTLHGTHGEKALEKIGRDLKCVECHNSVGPDHRDGAPKVTKYTASQSKIGTDKNVLSHDDIFQANSNCTDCHKPQKLQKKTWVHDVHALNLTCSACHVVHADGEQEGIQALERKSQIKMCVDCHSDFNSIKEE
jgi:cytochrome c-type protein NrfB